jgi:hypothetical protein
MNGLISETGRAVMFITEAKRLAFLLNPWCSI